MSLKNFIKTARSLPICLGHPLRPRANNGCETCTQTQLCKAKFKHRIKPYITVEKKGQNTTIDWDLGHFGYIINDKSILQLDTLFSNFADSKSTFERGASSGTYKVPTLIHRDFYIALLRILSDPENLTTQPKLKENFRDGAKTNE